MKVRCQECEYWSLDRVRKGWRICQVKNYFINPANQPRNCRWFKKKLSARNEPKDIG